MLKSSILNLVVYKKHIFWNQNMKHLKNTAWYRSRQLWHVLQRSLQTCPVVKLWKLSFAKNIFEGWKQKKWALERIAKRCVFQKMRGFSVLLLNTLMKWNGSFIDACKSSLTVYWIIFWYNIGFQLEILRYLCIYQVSRLLWPEEIQQVEIQLPHRGNPVKGELCV